MRRVARAGLLLLVLAVGLMAYVRFSPNDAARWQVDPVTAGVAGLSNGYLLRPAGGDAAAPVYAMPPAALAARIDAVARAWPRTRRFAGDPAMGVVTYITRTLVWGFPDFTTVKVLPAPGGATFAAFARARFGQGDFGVNKARLLAWLAALR
ncbi:MAG: DUF1499 domain-containing protein [Rhodobacteraceae bacterium]|nr:DUF1499 domain-containing protein [Paracoccaceae bacterium]